MPKPDLSPIDIRTPGLVDALGDVRHLHLWELLRRQRVPITAQALSKAARLPHHATQRALELFERVGLARSQRAKTRHPIVRWAATRQSIVVRVIARDAVDAKLLAQLDSILGPEQRRRLEAAIKPKAERVPGEQDFNGMHAAHLSAEDLAELWDLLMEIERFFHRCNNKFRNSAPETNHDCNYYFGVQLAPLRKGVLPLPTFGLISGPALDIFADKLSTEASKLLTPRELHVARSLAKGVTTAEVAKGEELSPHTVVEYTRRIYRKLGVKSRAQLAARLARA
jgi:DNA-binding CsgD family transcriptional regulator